MNKKITKLMRFCIVTLPIIDSSKKVYT